MIKDSHVAGDTLDETVVIPDYPATDGWTLKYFFTPRFTTPTQAQIVITATTATNGVDYLVQSSPATTATWTPGIYTWRRRVEKSGAAQTLDKNGNGGDWSGEFTVEQNPATAVQGYDGRTQAQKAVDDLRAALATFDATGGRINEFTIGTRQMKFESSPEILKMLSYWQIELRREEAAASIAKGLGNPRHTYVRMSRA